MELDSYFCDLGFPTQLSVSLIVPVLRGRFDSNVHVTGFATTSILYVHIKLRHKLHRCDIFGMLETESGKLTR